VRRVSDDVEVARWEEPTEGAWPGSEANLRFSPDGRFLCIRHPTLRRLTVRRLDGPEPVVCHQGTKVRGSKGDSAVMDFSPDSKRLAYIQTDSRIAVVDLASGQVSYLEPPSRAEQEHIQFAPDGRRFALCAGRAGKWAVEVWDALTGKVQRSLP